MSKEYINELLVELFNEYQDNQSAELLLRIEYYSSFSRTKAQPKPLPYWYGI